MRRREIDAGLARGRRLLFDLCRDLDDAIRSSGLTYASVGRAVGLSGDQVARICRGEARRAGVVQLAVLCAAVGLDLSVRAYPGGDPLRDGPQVAVLRRLRARLHRSLDLRLEVPVIANAEGAGRGDRRAWDAVVVGEHGSAAIEVETRVRDLQAVLRRIGLKRRDGDVSRLLLIVNDTAHHRQIVRAAGEALRAEFPGSARASFAALAAGRIPDADAILMV